MYFFVITSIYGVQGMTKPLSLWAPRWGSKRPHLSGFKMSDGGVYVMRFVNKTQFKSSIFKDNEIYF